MPAHDPGRRDRPRTGPDRGRPRPGRLEQLDLGAGEVDASCLVVGAARGRLRIGQGDHVLGQRTTSAACWKRRSPRRDGRRRPPGGLARERRSVTRYELEGAVVFFRGGPRVPRVDEQIAELDVGEREVLGGAPSDFVAAAWASRPRRACRAARPGTTRGTASSGPIPTPASPRPRRLPRRTARARRGRRLRWRSNGRPRRHVDGASRSLECRRNSCLPSSRLPIQTGTSWSSGARLRACSNAASAGAYSPGSAVSRTRWRRAEPRSRWAAAPVGSASMAACNRSSWSTVAGRGAGDGPAAATCRARHRLPPNSFQLPVDAPLTEMAADAVLVEDDRHSVVEHVHGPFVAFIPSEDGPHGGFRATSSVVE